MQTAKCLTPPRISDLLTSHPSSKNVSPPYAKENELLMAPVDLRGRGVKVVDISKVPQYRYQHSGVNQVGIFPVSLSPVRKGIRLEGRIKANCRASILNPSDLLPFPSLTAETPRCQQKLNSLYL